MVGIAGFGSADNLGGATLALFDPRPPNGCSGKEGVVDPISVLGDEGVDVRSLEADVRAVSRPARRS